MQSVFSGSSRQADRGHILHIKDEETEGSEGNIRAGDLSSNPDVTSQRRGSVEIFRHSGV